MRNQITSLSTYLKNGVIWLVTVFSDIMMHQWWRVVRKLAQGLSLIKVLYCPPNIVVQVNSCHCPRTEISWAFTFYVFITDWFCCVRNDVIFRDYFSKIYFLNFYFIAFGNSTLFLFYFVSYRKTHNIKPRIFELWVIIYDVISIAHRFFVFEQKFFFGLFIAEKK